MNIATAQDRKIVHWEMGGGACVDFVVFNANGNKDWLPDAGGCRFDGKMMLDIPESMFNIFVSLKFDWCGFVTENEGLYDEESSIYRLVPEFGVRLVSYDMMRRWNHSPVLQAGVDYDVLQWYSGNYGKDVGPFKKGVNSTYSFGWQFAGNIGLLLGLEIQHHSLFNEDVFKDVNAKMCKLLFEFYVKF